MRLKNAAVKKKIGKLKTLTLLKLTLTRTGHIKLVFCFPICVHKSCLGTQREDRQLIGEISTLPGCLLISFMDWKVVPFQESENLRMFYYSKRLKASNKIEM